MQRGLVFGLWALGCAGGTAVSGEPDAASLAPDVGPEVGIEANDAAVSEVSVGPLALPLALVGVGSAVGEGVLGPVYPFSVLASAEQVVVVGLARASFTWGTRTYPAGGFVLAIDPTTRDVRWHRTIGVSVNAIAALGDELVVVGDFSRSVVLEPAAAEPITLTAPGMAPIGSPSDGFVAVLSKTGTFRWARRFGSTGYDHAFGVTTTADAIVVTGNISGVADLGEGCGTLEASYGGDDGDGHPSGVNDGVVLRYGVNGACPWGAVFGAPAMNELAMSAAVRGDTIFVTGDTGLPFRLRTTTGVDRDLGGAPSKGTTPFLLEIDPKNGRTSSWLFKDAGRGGRGRSLATRGAELFWGLSIPNDSTLMRDGVTLGPVTAGAHVLSLGDGALHRSSDFGAKTTDIGSIAVGEAAVLAVATDSDPSGVVLARIDAKSLGLASYRAAVGMPFASTALGKELWIVGYSGTELSIGEPATKILVGPQGGFFLLRGKL